MEVSVSGDRPGWQVIEVLTSEKRDLRITRPFYTRALDRARPTATEVTTDRAPAYPRVLDELLPAACHVMEQYATTPIEAVRHEVESMLTPSSKASWHVSELWGFDAFLRKKLEIKS